MNCALCKTLVPQGKIMFRDECDHCGGDLHICLNCSFYDPNVSRQCQAGESASDAARRKLDGLFK